MTLQAVNLGFPRIGVARELKRALESFWSGRAPANELERVARELRGRHWRVQKDAGICHVPSNDFSLYDHVLDTAVMVGAVPARYRVLDGGLARYFAMARGHQDVARGLDLPALEMTKWFDTNYHYIVPELETRQRFELDATKIFGELEEARALGIETRPVILGPVTFLLLSKPSPGASDGARTLDHLEPLLEVYVELFRRLAAADVGWVQLDEPCLATDLDEGVRGAYRTAFRRLAGAASRPSVGLTTYFGPLRENLELGTRSGFEALHIDLVRGPEDLDPALESLPSGVTLSLGLVDGRNVWRTDLDRSHALLHRAVERLGTARVLVGPSCSLLHSPVSLAVEQNLDPEVRSWLAFATEKVREIVALARSTGESTPQSAAFVEARAALEGRRRAARTTVPAVRARVAAVEPSLRDRSSPYAKRAPLQAARFELPAFPTTTIGSFPQTRDVRAARASWRAKKTSDAEYQAFLEAETRRCVERQEALGLDVLVHGELERNDMVEYFGEQLEGFAFTDQGWVQSYGSRCVKPPIIFGDVSRPGPMTVSWSRFAQSLTRRPMKGMLTGPVTILQWSFVRDDQPRSDTCLQIALALRDEVLDLERAGIGMIQVDEPAIREGLPLRASERLAYLRWAVDAFRITTAGVADDTQIHTHMCYSEFGDMLDSVAAMDADVLSIETSRSKLELLDDFRRFEYPNAIGPGVYDIHSPRVPSREEIAELLSRAATVLPIARLWVNPDCGLKTRSWAEVEPALANMVAAARDARATLT